MKKGDKDKKVALVTGAARGIGRGIAEELAASGFNIAVADILEKERGKEALSAYKKKGAKTCYIQADVSTASDRKKIVEQVKSSFGRLDVLVNNAGVAPEVRADILEVTEESLDRVMSINLKGPYFLTQAVANWMIEQKKGDDSRTPMIINISSIFSYTSSPNRGEYCISKAAINMMTILYADRLAQYGILVYEIRPGIILTDITAKEKDKYDKLITVGLLPIKRWGFPADVGKAVIVLTQGYFAYSTGQVINVDGGFHIRRL